MTPADRDAERQVAVDFDDTIATIVGGELVLKEGVIDALRKIQSCGYKVVIHSARCWQAWPDTWERVGEMHDFLEKKRVPYDGIYMGVGKLAAVAYIDDKGIRFKDNWDEIANWLSFQAASK